MSRLSTPDAFAFRRADSHGSTDTPPSRPDRFPDSARLSPAHPTGPMTIHVRHGLGWFALCALLCVHPAAASDVRWRVALDDGDPNISIPGFPAQHSFETDFGNDEGGAGLANAGGGLLGFQTATYVNFATPDGNWYERSTGMMQYAATGVTGALGPNRIGTESGDVFRVLYYGDTFDGGTRAFSATANNPAASANDATMGIWQFDGTKNIEIARVGTDGPLGPNLGSGVVYTALQNVYESGFNGDVRSLDNRRVMFAGRIGQSGASGNDGLSVYTPGVGNTPCLLPGSTDPSGNPGITNYVFNTGAGNITVTMTVSPRGEAYALASASRVQGAPQVGPNAFAGIWQFCDGSPKPGVLTGFSGQYGPNFPGGTAVFGGDGNGLWQYVAPSTPGSYFFTSGGLMSTQNGAPRFLGVFHHDAVQSVNTPIFLHNSDDSTGYGPHIAGHVFYTNLVPYNIAASGRYGVVRTNIAPTGSSTADATGLWRFTTDGNVQPVAIGGNTGAYAPAPGRTWDGTFYKFTVFDDGEIVTLARTNNTAASTTSISWWRLAPGAAPVEILKVGDLVDVPTPGGVVAKAVTSISPYYREGLPSAASRDTWFTADGRILAADVALSGYPNTTLLIRGQAARPDYIFATGND